MIHPRKIAIRVLSASAIAWVLLSTAAIAQPASGRATPQHESITGTIWRIDSRAGTLELLTAVGHSVRVRSIRFVAGLRVKAGSADAGIAALVPGAVCRFECEPAASGMTATGVELLQPAPGREQ